MVFALVRVPASCNFGNNLAIFVQHLMNVLHFSCLLSYLKACKNMLLHETLCSNAHSLLRYVRVELCRRFLPLALCSNVLLVFLPKPSAILPRTVLTVLFGLSCELYFSAAISLFPFQLCAPSGAGSSVTQSSHHAEVLRGFWVQPDIELYKK